jgi:rsbT co-antagonist protein RsbR
MSSISKVADYLDENAENFAVEIVVDVINRMKITIPGWEKEQAIKMYTDFFGFLANLIHSNQETIPEDLVAWSEKNGEREATSGGKISEIIVRYPPTRASFTELITKISLEYGLSVEENAFIIKQIDAMLDISINETVFAFERLSDKLAEQTQKDMAELSAPIVPIREGVAVLPFIGSIDEYRAAYILDNVVPKISQLQIDHVIADFSGILTIDVAVAHYLYQVQNVLSLLGINTIVTGLRPQLAQTVVNGGIDMSSITTYATVRQALESIHPVART